MTKTQKKVGGVLVVLFFVWAFCFFGFLFTTALAQEYTEDNPLILEDGTPMTGDVVDINPHPDSRLGQMENDPTMWQEIGFFQNKRIYLNTKKIEKAGNYTHVWAMMEFVDGAKVIPGVTTGVVRIVGEASIDCGSTLTQAIRDYYVDENWFVKHIETYPPGQGISFARVKGTMAWAMHQLSCLGNSIDDVRIGEGV